MLGLYYFPEILRDNIGILQLLPSLSEKIYIYSLIKRFYLFFFCHKELVRNWNGILKDRISVGKDETEGCRTELLR